MNLVVNNKSKQSDNHSSYYVRLAPVFDRMYCK